MINLHIDPKPDQKTFSDMSDNEYIQFIEQEYIDKKDILDNEYELEKLCAYYFNQSITIDVRKQIPKDPLWIKYSLEAWNINETIKKIIAKFKEFFPKIFNYILGFVVLRVKSAKIECEKWLQIIRSQDKDQSKLDKIFNDTSVKTAKVEIVTQMLDSASGAYEKISNAANNLKGFKGIGNSDSDKAKLEEMTTMPPEYNKFIDNKKLIDEAQPSKEDPTGSKGFTYKDGSWDDPAKIAKMVDAMDHVVGVLENIKRLQSICDEMVRDLGKEQKGESAEKNLVKELNDEKIKFLRNLSKNILSGMMGSIASVTSMAAKHCKAFCNKYGEES